MTRPKYREDECAPMPRDWRDEQRDAAQDAAKDLGGRRRLTDAEVRLMAPNYPSLSPRPRHDPR